MNTATNSKSWEQQSYKLAREISVFLHAGKTEKEKKKTEKKKTNRNSSSDSYS